jgi:hypothetical protein
MTTPSRFSLPVTPSWDSLLPDEVDIDLKIRLRR